MDALDITALVLVLGLLFWWLSRLRVVKSTVHMMGYIVSHMVKPLSWLIWVTFWFPLYTYRTTRTISKKHEEITFVLLLASVVFVLITPEPWIMAGRFIVVGSLWTLWIIRKKKQKANQGKIRPIAYRKPQKEDIYDSR